MEYGASCEDVARVCHPHPVSEVVEQVCSVFLQILSINWSCYIFTLEFCLYKVLEVFDSRLYRKRSVKPISVLTLASQSTVFRKTSNPLLYVVNNGLTQISIYCFYSKEMSVSN